MNKLPILYSISLLTGILLSSCSAPKEKLAGKRVDFLGRDAAGVSVDSAAASRPYVQPAASASASFTQASQRQLPAALAKDIKLLWKERHGSGHNIIGMPLAIDKVIYFIDSQHEIHAADLATGKKLWSFKLPGVDTQGDPVSGALAWDSGILYATSSTGEVFALDSRTRKILWTYRNTVPLRSAPTVADGKVFIVNVNNETVALSAKDGTEIWTHAGVFEPACLFGGAAPVYQDGSLFVTLSSGEVYALDVASGQPSWNYTLIPTLRIESACGIPHARAHPVIEGDRVYVVSQAGCMTALDRRTGQEVWRQEIGGMTPPAIAGDYLYLINGSQEIVCLDKSTGRGRWVRKLPRPADNNTNWYWSGPVAAGDELLALNSEGTLYRFSAKDGTAGATLSIGDDCYLPPVIIDKQLIVLTDSAALWTAK